MAKRYFPKTSLAKLHIPFYIDTHMHRRTLPERVLSLLREFNATQLFCNIEYEVDELRRDIKVCKLAKSQSVKPTFCHDKCIIEPGIITSQGGKPYVVRPIFCFPDLTSNKK
jgi:deoxyribodipyrimidine photo-lyase